jgi:MBG domain (YGX type)/YDG domain/Bacterial Ig-like domain (group 3)/Invasin, domain 3/Kelch motif
MRKPAAVSLVATVILSVAVCLHAQSLTPSATGSWTVTGAMSQARSGAAAAALTGGRVLVTGGTDASGTVSASAEIYGANGGFTMVAPMNVPRTGHTATLLQNGPDGSGGYVLVTGGTSTGGVVLASAEWYDPAANTWTLLPAPMIDARTGEPAALLSSSSLVLSGGSNGSSLLSSMEQFDLSSQQFSFVGALPTARNAHAAAALHDGRVLLVGGTDANGNTLASTAIYDPVAGTVSFGPNLSTPRANATATTLLDGTVLIAGGSYPEGAPANGNIAELQSAEIFDPVAGTMTPASAKLAQARAGHQAFLLPNNNAVLLVGGSYNGADLASSELYTPWLGQFATTGSMSVARSRATGAALFPLADGQLLVAGGSNQNSAELYGFATVETDASDYAPGTPVIMSGTGWKPQESVSLYLQETPNIDTPPTMTTVADAKGNILDGAFAPDVLDVGIRFYLTAVGATSGLQAQNTFTDGNAGSGDGTMTVAPASVTAGSTGNTFAFTFASPSGNDFNAGSQATLQIPSGWTTPQTTVAGNPGYVSLSNITCASAVLHSPAISGTGPWTITVDMTCAKNGKGFNINFAGGGTEVTVPSTSGSYTFTAQTKQSGGTLTGIATSPTVVVTAGAATAGNSTVSASPTSVVADGSSTSTITVTLKDAYNNLANGRTVTLGQGSGHSTISPASGITNSSGVVTFTVKDTTAEAVTYTATDTTDSNLVITQTAAVTFTPGALDHFLVEKSGGGAIGTQIAGTAFALRVTAKDVNNNTVTSFTSTASLTSTGTLTGSPVTTAAFTAGVLDPQSVTITSTGSVTITATASSKTGISAAFTVNAGPATQLAFTTQPAGAVAGTAFTTQPKVTVQDANGNTVTTSSAPITLAMGTNPNGGILACTANPVSASSGVATFAGCNISASGADTLTASAAGLATGTSSPFTVGAANTTTSVPTSSGNPSTYGNSVTFTATVSPSAATGTIVFKDGSTTLGTGTLSGGTASYTTTASQLTAGSNSITAVYSGDTNYNTSTSSSALSQSVNQKALSVSGIGANNKTYDGTTTATLTGTPGTLVGIVGSDSVSFSGTAVGTFASAGAGTGISVSVSGQSLTGTNAGNYTLTEPTTSANITPKRLTVSGIGANNKTYDGTTAATLTGTPGTLVGVVGSDSVSLSGSAVGTFASASVGTGISVSVSGQSLTGTNASNYTLTEPTTSANITAKALTVSGIGANNKTYDGTTTATLTGTPGTLVGIVGSDSVSLSGTAVGTFSSKNAGTGVSISVSGQSLTGPNAGNYTLTEPTTSANISAKALTASGVSANNKIYDATTTATVTGTAALQASELAGSGTASDGKPYTSDNVNVGGTPGGTFAGANVGTGITVTISGLSLGGSAKNNYTLTAPSTTANITAKALTVSGLSASNKIYDGTTAASLTGTASLQTSEAAGNGTSSDGKPYTGDAVNVGGAVIGTFVSATVANGITVNISGLSLTGASAGNYSLTAPSTTANITPKALTVSGLAVLSHTYDGTTTASLDFTSAALNGVVSADTNNVSLNQTGYTATFASKNVGPSIAVTVSGLTLSGSAAGNYTLTQPTGLTGPITARPITVTATANSKTYDGTTLAAAIPTITGTLASGDTANFSEAYAGKNVGTNLKLISSGSMNDGNGGANYSVTFVSTTTGTISAKSLTVSGLTVNSRNYDATTAATLNFASAALSGVVSADTTNVSLNQAGYTATLASPNVGTQGVTVSNLALMGSAAGNYTLTQPTGLTGIITAAAASVTPNPTSKTYGTSDPVLSGTLSGFVAADNVTATYSRTAGETVLGSPYPISAVLSPASVLGNYTITYNTASFTITPAPVSVTLSNLSQSYTGSPLAAGVAVVPAVSYAITYTGIAPTVYPASSNAPTDPGSYAVVVAVTDTNYTGAAADTLVITRKDPALNLALESGSPEPSPYGTVVYFDLATANSPRCPTGTVNFYVDYVDNSSQPAATQVLDGSNCTQPVVFSTATLTPTMTATMPPTSSQPPHAITAMYSGDGYYLSATSNLVQHNITPDGTAVTLATTGSSVYVGDPITFTATVTPTNSVGSGAEAPAGTVQFNEVTVDGQNNVTGTLGTLGTSQLSAAAPYVAGFSDSLLPAGGHSVQAVFVNQDGMFLGSSSAVQVETVNRIVPTITWQPAVSTIVYGTALSSDQLNASAADTHNNINPIAGTFTYDSPLGTVLPAGSKNVTVTFNPTDTATYTPQTATVTLTVQPATLTVTADNQSRSYGGDNPILTFQYSGFVHNEDPSIVTTAPVCSTQASASSAVGGYDITCSGAVAPNYTFSYQKGTLTVTAAPLGVTADNQSKTYDGAPFTAFTASYSGFVNGEGPSALGGTLGFGGNAVGASGAGSYTITPGGLTSSNYAITFNNGTLTINKAPASVTPNAASKIYGDADPAFIGTLTGFVASDHVTASYSRTAGETVLGSPYPISAVLSPASVLSNYNITYNTASFTITPKNASVTPSAASKTYGTSDLVLSGTLSGFVAADNVTATYSRTAGETVLGSPYPISAVLSPASVLSNYNITYKTASLSVTPAPASVTPAAASKTYGDPEPALSGTLTGFVPADNVTAAYSRTAGETVGGAPYTISAVLSPAPVLSNYNITYNTANFTITRKTASVTPAAASKTYGASDPVLTGTLSGFVAGDVTASYSRTAGETAGNSPYTISAVLSPPSVLGNYTITYNTANFTINRAPLTITASSGSMTYGGLAFIVTPGYSGFVNGDTPASLTAQPICSSTAGSSSPVNGSPYPSTCAGATDNNYTIAYVPGTVVVSQATAATAVISSVNPSTYMQLVSFTATVSPQYSGVPTGTVTFYNNGTQIGTGALSVVNGQDIATFSTTLLPDIAPDIITASYGGDGNFLTSSAAMTQSVQPAPNVSLNPMFMSFGNQNVNTTSKGATITLTNKGDASLDLYGISISGANAGDFAEMTNCGLSLAVGKSCIITITFKPIDTGTRVASLQIADNDDDTNAQQLVSLTGAGLSTITGASLYSDAIFATGSGCGSIVLSGNSTVDSFNSIPGYSASHQNSGGNVGTNGNVTLNGNSTIYGSASVASMATGSCSKASVTGLTNSGKSLVAGGLAQLDGATTYPLPPAPNPAPPTTSQNISGSCGSGIIGCTNAASKSVVLAPGQYGNLSVSGGTAVHFNKGNYNINSLTLSGNSILSVDSGPVVINLAGASLSGSSPAMDLTGGSIQNPGGNPAQLQFVYAGSRGINLSGGAAAFATVYAPLAFVNMSGGTDFFGSIIGGTVTGSGGTAIHRDTNLLNIPANDYLWVTAVVSNVAGLPSNSQVKLYLSNASIQYSVNGVQQTPIPVPSGVITFNSAAFASGSGATTSYDAVNNRWSTAIGSKSLTGNTFATAVAIPVPAGGLPNGLQDVHFSVAFSTDTPGISLQWQWGASVYNNSAFNTICTSLDPASGACAGTTYPGLSVNPEDGSADAHGTDAAGTPEAVKQDVIFGGTGGGLTNYTGYFSSGAGVVPTIAPMSVSPSSLALGTQSQGTASPAMSAVLTNNDSVVHNFVTPNGATGPIYISGANAAEFTLVAGPNNCVGMPSLASGASCSVYVTFMPSYGGGVSESAKVVLNSNATNSPQTVYLSGTGQ